MEPETVVWRRRSAHFVKYLVLGFSVIISTNLFNVSQCSPNPEVEGVGGQDYYNGGSSGDNSSFSDYNTDFLVTAPPPELNLFSIPFTPIPDDNDDVHSFFNYTTTLPIQFAESGYHDVYYTPAPPTISTESPPISGNMADAVNMANLDGGGMSNMVNTANLNSGGMSNMANMGNQDGGGMSNMVNIANPSSGGMSNMANTGNPNSGGMANMANMGNMDSGGLAHLANMLGTMNNAGEYNNGGHQNVYHHDLNLPIDGHPGPVYPPDYRHLHRPRQRYPIWYNHPFNRNFRGKRAGPSQLQRWKRIIRTRFDNHMRKRRQNELVRDQDGKTIADTFMGNFMMPMAFVSFSMIFMDIMGRLMPWTPLGPTPTTTPAPKITKVEFNPPKIPSLADLYNELKMQFEGVKDAKDMWKWKQRWKKYQKKYGGYGGWGSYENVGWGWPHYRSDELFHDQSSAASDDPGPSKSSRLKKKRIGSSQGKRTMKRKKKKKKKYKSKPLTFGRLSELYKKFRPSFVLN